MKVLRHSCFEAFGLRLNVAQGLEDLKTACLCFLDAIQRARAIRT